MVARPSLISIKNRSPSLVCYTVFKRKASFLGIREERAEWTEHLLSMEKVWEGKSHQLWQITIQSYENCQNMKPPEEIFLLNAVE